MIIPLGFVLFTVIAKGASIISTQFLFGQPIPPNVAPAGEGGLWPAVLGTIEITALATVLAAQNQQSEAAAERKIAADLMRAHMNLQRAQVANNAGQSLLKSGNISEAIVQFKDALSYDPNYVDAHLGLANALERQGDVIDAAAERQKASDLKKSPGVH